MLGTLDTIIAFVVILTVVSLLITILVQMVSAALSLRGKNLANALALTFQSIDPQIGKQAYLLADHILKDPVLSDSLFRPKSRPAVATPTLLQAVATQAASEKAKITVAVDSLQAALGAAPNAVQRHAADQANAVLQMATDALTDAKSNAAAALTAAAGAPSVPPVKLVPRKAPWSFVDLRNFKSSAFHLATAVRPGEVYQMLRLLSRLSDDEAGQRGFAGLNACAANVLKALGVPDGPALEAQDKLVAIGKIADLFTTPAQKKAVLDSLETFGSTLELASAQAYDHFQRWFGSAQDRAEQWFQAHTRNVTIVFSVVLAFALQLDTIEIFRQLRDAPGLTQALVNSAPGVVASGKAVLDTGSANATPFQAYGRWRQQHPLFSLPDAPLPATASGPGDYEAAIAKRLAAPPDPAYALGEFDARLKSASMAVDAPGSAVARAYQAWVAEFPAYALPPEDAAKAGTTGNDPAPVRAALAQSLARAGSLESQDQSTRAPWVDDYKRAYLQVQQENYAFLKNNLDQTGFDLVPSPLFARWKNEHWKTGFAWWKNFLPHGVGMLVTAALLTLGAPFWFNLLKNLMSLRPAVATLVERRPRSAPALPQSPPSASPS